MSSKIGFIIDTNKYSGNFERQMCAFMTGHMREHDNTGRRYAEDYLCDYNLLEGVARVLDEQECMSPVEICTTPNVWNNGYGFHFKDGEEELALEECRKFIKEDKEKWIQILESYKGKSVQNWTDESLDTSIKRYRKEIEDAMMLKEANKYPAYQSLIIYFEEDLKDETIEFLKKRAYEFAERKSNKNLEIIGFRLEKDEEIITI